MIIKTFITLFCFLISVQQDESKNSSIHSGINNKIFIRALPDTFSFCGERVPLEIPDVKERMEDIYYSRIGNDDRIFLQLKRTRRYFPLFEKILKEMDAPDDLKYLSVAESSLRIDAYSNADAAGLWQFIPSTGKLWGLRVDKQIDERFHVEKSTRAAIRMLKSLRAELGSWSLAAAAYNNGLANINRVIKEQKENNYFDLFLNKETRNYIFHIVVMKEILDHPHDYGYVLADNDYHLPYDESTHLITVAGPVSDLGQWAKDQGTNYKTVKLHNYWIMKNVLPDGYWELILPKEIKISGSRPDTTYGAVSTTETSFFIEHIVQEGESLNKIAKQYDVPVSDILKWNNLKSDVVFLNARLKIELTISKRIVHYVRTGDTLIRIAALYRVSQDQIKEWNKLTGDVISVGKSLTIYAGSVD
ncbi:LysM peptidoglycan-binding domain-containing protein [bacterium]|nr:LysM peptidoglycan-binding domain-containing protein [bacterium]